MNEEPIELRDILQFVHTAQERREFIERINLTNDYIFNVDIKIDEKIKELFPYEIATALLDVCKRNQIDVKDPVSLQKFLKYVKEEIGQMPVINIVLAFAPSGDLLSKIAEWFLTTYKRAALIEVKVNRKLVAGIEITYKGIYRDYSLRKKFEEVLAQKKFLKSI